jgi:hypothetical protein
MPTRIGIGLQIPRQPKRGTEAAPPVDYGTGLRYVAGHFTAARFTARRFFGA